MKRHKLRIVSSPKLRHPMKPITTKYQIITHTTLTRKNGFRVELVYTFFLTVSRFETEKRKMIALFHRPHYVVYTSSVNICFKFSIYSRIRSFHNPISKTNLHLAQLNTDDIHSSSALYTL